MKEIIDTSIDPRIVKEIEYVPISNRVDARTFSRLKETINKVIADVEAI